jgi:hypothetical protein
VLLNGVALSLKRGAKSVLREIHPLKNDPKKWPSYQGHNRNPVKEHNLSKNTKPRKLANIFLPLKNEIRTGPGSFSFHKLMQWTHTKAIFADTGNSY